jgi:hypothetical protein
VNGRFSSEDDLTRGSFDRIADLFRKSRPKWAAAKPLSNAFGRPFARKLVDQIVDRSIKMIVDRSTKIGMVSALQLLVQKNIA